MPPAEMEEHTLSTLGAPCVCGDGTLHSRYAVAIEMKADCDRRPCKALATERPPPAMLRHAAWRNHAFQSIPAIVARSSTASTASSARDRGRPPLSRDPKMQARHGADSQASASMRSRSSCMGCVWNTIVAQLARRQLPPFTPHTVGDRHAGVACCVCNPFRAYGPCPAATTEGQAETAGAGRRRRFRSSALTATSTLDPDMVSAAISGRSTSPNAGSNTPAAMGRATAL